MFSIIVPLYNKQPYIVKAIESICQQTYQNFEVLIVNDGSTDRSYEIAITYVESLKINNIHLFNKFQIINQENSGVSVARNNAAKIAQYDYLAFLDADDWWEPTYLEEMYNLVQEFPNAGLWASRYFVVKNKTKRLARIGLNSHFKKGIIDYFKVYSETLEMPVWTGATIIKKTTFFENNGFKSNIALGEDFDLWLRVLLNHSLAFLNTPLSNYNFDIDLKNRAVDNYKIYIPQKHYIFNLDYLEKEELINQDLKILLDKLRLYTLFPYYFKNVYIEEYKKEISKVDFSKFPIYVKIQFKLPITIINLWINLKIIVSKYLINKLILFKTNFFK
jgi:glycosyltransferase involved in cell wall biosynthesis